ncbi:hypothetical protein Q8A67_023032 [Cirrhinus molitorella]|uniref:Uncharacterized protein n=1 Tax=Cirrhinus molitorella TaxID=172907 RepID=A0AA88P674_9TELE|nr:hypothetical protein Q8A67_023032 [Cirrhinus molitorella]
MLFSPFIGIKLSYLGSVQPWLVIPLITQLGLRYDSEHVVQKHSTALAFTIITTPIYTANATRQKRNASTVCGVAEGILTSVPFNELELGEEASSPLPIVMVTACECVEPERRARERQR